MARSSWKLRGMRRAFALSVWFYGLLLYAYPKTFRQTYGERITRVFRDNCRAALQQRSVLSLIFLWLQTLSDLVCTACLEHWHVFKEKGHAMAPSRHIQHFPLRLWVALAATVIAFAVSLVASLNLYLLEDTSPLTQAAYSASSLLRFSYDGVYLSVLAAGVAVCHHTSLKKILQRRRETHGMRNEIKQVDSCLSSTHLPMTQMPTASSGGARISRRVVTHNHHRRDFASLLGFSQNALCVVHPNPC